MTTPSRSVAMAVAGLLWSSAIACGEPVVGHYPEGHPVAQVAASDRVRDALDAAAVRLAYLGDFVDVAQGDALDTVRASLPFVWDAGAVYVLNLMTTTTLRPLAYPVSAADWGQWAPYYALAQTIRAWGDGCGAACYVLLVPWPEMNGGWVSYGGQPAEFREAFGRLRYVLWSQGALPYVRLVWGPASDVTERLAPYAPGAWADVVGCSAYEALDGPTGVRQCVAALRVLAPGVPILLTQTGACQPQSATWARQLVVYLRQQPDVRGFVWFEYLKECDWRLTPTEWRWAVAPLDPRRP